MASPQASNSLKSKLYVKNYVHDIADATVATDIGWVDMSLYRRALIGVTLVSGTGLLTFKILGNSSSAGSGTDVELKVCSDPTDADAAGDTRWLEVSAEELAQEASDSGNGTRYISANVDADHADDIFVVTYILEPKWADLDLTADVTAA